MRSPLVPAALALLLAIPAAAQEGIPAPAPAAARLDSAATIATGRQYTTWFYTDMGDSIIAHSSAQVKERVTAAQLSEFLGQLTAQAGQEVEVLSERVVARDSLSAYLREVTFEMIEEPLVVAFTLGATGDVYGFFIRPKSQMPAGNPE